jgi:hypothetical protein
MREHVIERYLCQRVREHMGIAVKFTSSNNRGVPDRLCLLPGAIIFVEVKAPGKTPFKLQRLWLLLLRALGHHAVVIDSRPKVDALMIWYKRFVANKFNANAPVIDKLLKAIRG